MRWQVPVKTGLVTGGARVSSKAFEVVLFHSLLGRRPSVLEWARRLSAEGYVVHTPDLYGGEVFDDMRAAAGWLQAIGFDGMLDRARESVSALSSSLVYAGFSNGGACAELLAATRPGACGAVLMHAPLQIRDLGWAAWPAGVPVQTHFAKVDPLRSAATIDSLRKRVGASGSEFQEFTYPEGGHLFSDSGLAAYSLSSSDTMFANVVQFLRWLDGRRGHSPDRAGHSVLT